MSDRRWHKLKHNKKTSTPSAFLAIDVEWRPEDYKTEGKHKAYLFSGCFVRIRYDRGGKIEEEWKVTEDGDEFWKWVWSKASKGYLLRLYGHKVETDLAAGQFLQWMRDNGGEVKRIYKTEKTFAAMVRLGNKKIQIVDTFNYFPVALEEVGRWIGKEKLQVDYDNSPLDEMITYCKRDVEIIKDAMLEFIRIVRKEDWGKMGLSLAGMSWNLFRHKFYKTPVYIHNNKQALQLERDALCGGRCECFKLGECDDGRYYYVDFNSLYPSVARDLEVPKKYEGTYANISVKLLEKLLESYAVIAEVTVEVDKPYFPKRINNEIIYPIGRFRTILADPELRFAMARGLVKKVWCANIYEKGKIFTEFVDFTTSRKEKARKEGNLLEAEMYKLIANSIYGKFAQKQRTIVKVGESDEEKYEREIHYGIDPSDVRVYLYYGNEIFESKKGGETHDSFPAITACVLSAARVRMLELIEKVGWENIIYIDTDALIVTTQGFERLQDELDQTRLGKLKLEDEADKVVVYGKKDYIFADKVKVKGVKRGAEKIGEGVYKVKRFRSLTYHMEKGILDGFVEQEVVLHLSRAYRGGQVEEDGRVIPFVLYEA